MIQTIHYKIFTEPQVVHKKRRGRPPSAKKLKRSLLSTDRRPVDNSGIKLVLR